MSRRRRCGTCFFGTEMRCPHVAVAIHSEVGGYRPDDNGPPWENCRFWKPTDWKPPARATLPELLEAMDESSVAAKDELFPEAFKRLKGTAKSVVCLKTDNPGIGIKSLEGCCCCNCRYHHEDHSHPLTDGGVVTHIRGWICGGSEVGYYSEWGEHGLCECHELKEAR